MRKWITYWIAITSFASPRTGGTERPERPLLAYVLEQFSPTLDDHRIVRRMDLDVTGDTEPELFIALAMRHDSWFVFQKTADGRYRRIALAQFSGDRFRVDRDPVRLVY